MLVPIDGSGREVIYDEESMEEEGAEILVGGEGGGGWGEGGG